MRQAYKDLVNIWHPDRVGDNARLKKKAEEKLKDINLAYEELNSFLSSPKKVPPVMQETPREQPKPEAFNPGKAPRTETEKDPTPPMGIQPKSNFFSGLWTFLSRVLDALSAAQGSSNEPMETRRTSVSSAAWNVCSAGNWGRESLVESQRRGVIDTLSPELHGIKWTQCPDRFSRNLSYQNTPDIFI